jgi:hypothetical protein
MESPKPNERQKRKISHQFWEKISGDPCTGSFLESPAAHLPPPEIQTSQDESLFNILILIYLKDLYFI